MFLAVKCTRWRKNLVRWGLHLENKFLKLHIHVQNCWVPSPSMNSRVASIMCSILKLHYLNSLLILHKSGQSMCQPVTDCALLTEHGKIFTLLNFTSSFDVKQWSKSQQYIQKQLCIYKRLFPVWLIQAANSLVYATLLKKNKSITSRAISWSLIHWQLASFIQCYIKQCIGR